MTSSVLLKIFAGLAALSATAYGCLWYAAGERNNGWLLHLACIAIVTVLTFRLAPHGYERAMRLSDPEPVAV